MSAPLPSLGSAPEPATGVGGLAATQGVDQRLRALAEAGRGFGSARDEHHLFDLAVALALDVLDADAVSLTQYDRALGVSKVLRNFGDLAEWEEEAPADETYGLDEFDQQTTMIEAGQPWVGSLDDPATSAADVGLLRSLGKRHAVSLPVHLDEVTWGDLYATRGDGRPPFGAVDVAAGEAFTGLLSGALAHLRDRASLREMAYRDRLTGLGNRRAVDEWLEAAFDRDGPLPRPLGVVLGDVNGLKAVNDRYGHGEGDRLLRRVAAVLTEEVGHHPRGLAARLGGDEFCLVLDGTTDEELAEVAARVSAATSALTLGEGMSCGWAVADSRPGDAPTGAAAARALLRLADAVQYREKRRTRAQRAQDAGGVAPAPPELPAGLGSAATTGRALAAGVLEAVEAAAGAEARLVALASTAATMLDCASWWVSSSTDGGPMRVVQGGYLRPTDDGPDSAPMVPGDCYELDDYPASAAALEGGSFHASLGAGERSEQEFLAANGYAEILAAGARAGDTGWLVELCADALSAPLAEHEGLLLVLVRLAVSAPNVGR